MGIGRLAGALLLTGCGAWWGLRAAGNLQGRVRALEAWEGALTLLAGELAFSLPDLPRLLDFLSRRALPPAGETFGAALRGLEGLGELSFPEVWTRALAGTRGCLSPGDADLLDRLGNILGRYGWEEQTAAADRLRAGLELRRQAAGEEAGRKGRTYTTLGLALGAFVAILLL